jgi:hypothetical protein
LTAQACVTHICADRQPGQLALVRGRRDEAIAHHETAVTGAKRTLDACRARPHG